MDKLRLYETMHRQSERLSALLEIGRDISATLDLPTVLKRIARHARELLAAHDSDIYLIEPDGQTLRPIVSYGRYIEETLAMPIRMGKGIVGWVAKSGIAEVINYAETDPRSIQIPGTPKEPYALLCAPLIFRERTMGIMALGRHGNEKLYVQEDLDFLVSLARQAAVAIENARLYATEQRRREELAQALKQQQELDRLKNEFIQNVSHELRTPVTIIHGYADLLVSGELGELNPEQRQPVTVIANRADSLRKLVDDLTALLEAQARDFGRVKIDLSKLVEKTLIDFMLAAKSAKLDFQVAIEPDLPQVLGNKDFLTRMIENLIDNALKFTPSGGCVKVVFSRQESKNVIEVIDTGVGIPEDHLSRIFERFYQVDGGITRRYGGTGLGLALVKEIVSAHHGEITVASQVGRGSLFRVSLPALVDVE
ncbi:MAG: GAF domain-containing protein [Anaerolineales bacterium]|nr:GAF domain-containing protein [Anaerolineales bacterium]